MFVLVVVVIIVVIAVAEEDVSGSLTVSSSLAPFATISSISRSCFLFWLEKTRPLGLDFYGLLTPDILIDDR